MNKCVLIGNLTKDPELRTIASTGNSVCNFTIAVSRRFENQKGERDVDFIPIVVWKVQAENCAKYLRKGSQVAVSGSIQTRTYEAQDKTRRYVTEILADEVKFLNRVATTKPESPNQPEQPRHHDEFEGASDMQEIDEDMPF